VVRKEDEAHYFKASDYYQKGRRLMREGQFEEAINVLYQSYEIVMRYICPPPRPPQMMLPKTHDALAQAFLLSGNRDKCIEHLKAALALQIELHGGVGYEYPELIRDYARLSMLTKDISFTEKAIDLMERCFAPSEFLEAEKLWIRRNGGVVKADQ
jgi:tetratricopeptide (TPR) repeat protein